MSLDYVRTWFLSVASILNSTSNFYLLSTVNITTSFTSDSFVCSKIEHLNLSFVLLIFYFRD